jgi:hypothetical protein
MRRYNIVSRIPLILTAITLALAAPVLVQEKRQVPEDVITVLGKRILAEDFDMMWDVWWHHLNVLTDIPPLPQLLRPYRAEVKMPEVHVPPQGPADSDRKSMELVSDAPPEAPQSSQGSSTETESDQWSTISNAPSEEPQPEDLKAADSDLKVKEKVLRRISGTASGADSDMVNTAQMELWSADPVP